MLSAILRETEIVICCPGSVVVSDAAGVRHSPFYNQNVFDEMSRQNI